MPRKAAAGLAARAETTPRRARRSRTPSHPRTPHWRDKPHPRARRRREIFTARRAAQRSGMTHPLVARCAAHFRSSRVALPVVSACASRVSPLPSASFPGMSLAVAPAVPGRPAPLARGVPRAPPRPPRRPPPRASPPRRSRPRRVVPASSPPLPSPRGGAPRVDRPHHGRVRRPRRGGVRRAPPWARSSSTARTSPCAWTPPSTPAY